MNAAVTHDVVGNGGVAVTVEIDRVEEAVAKVLLSGVDVDISDDDVDIYYFFWYVVDVMAQWPSIFLAV